MEKKNEIGEFWPAGILIPLNPPWDGEMEAQIAALEKKRHADEVSGEFETAHPGYLGSHDTFYVGTLKGVGRVYQQTFVDTYSKVAFAKWFTTKTKVKSPQTNGICERFHKTICRNFTR